MRRVTNRTTTVRQRNIASCDLSNTKSKPMIMPEQVVLRHLDHMRRRGLSPRSMFDREGVLRRLSLWLSHPLLEATPEELTAWQASLGVSLSALGTYTSHVRAFYSWAADDDMLPRSPATKLPMPKLPHRKPRPIPEDDLRLALSCATGQMYLWMVCMAFLGLRAAEVAAVQCEDFAEDGKRWTLLVHGKGDKERLVPVPSQVIGLLRPLMGHRGALFTNPATGRTLTAHRVTIVVADHLHGLGMPWTGHTLRHRYGSRMYALSKDLRELQELMGHGSPNTTAGYVAANTKAASRTSERLGRTLKAA